MGFFSKSKSSARDEKKRVLVFDIGSSSVGGALFEVQKSSTPKILMTLREPINLEEEINPDKLLSLTTKALESVANKMHKALVGRPAEIFCALSSSWYASQTRVIKFQKNTPFIFNAKLAESLIQKEIDIFQTENIKNFPHSDNKIRLVEWKNIKTILNGYVTLDPLGKKTKSVEMSVFISIAQESFLTHIEETIYKSFHLKEIGFISFALVSFTIVRDMLSNRENFILMDITGEITDISIVNKGVLFNSVSYPLGTNFFIREISIALGVSLDEGKSMLSLFRDGHAEASVEKKLVPIIDRMKKEWLNQLSKSLIDLSENLSVPRDIFVTVDSHLQNFFSDIIKNEQFGQHALSYSKWHIVFVDAKTLYGAVSFETNIDRDPFLAAEAIYLNRFVC